MDDQDDSSASIPDSSLSETDSRNTPERSQTERVILYIADHVICGLLLGPLTVFAWRGAWKLLDVYLLPDNPIGSGFVCFTIGNAGLMILVLLQDELKKRIRRHIWWHWLFGYHFYSCVCFFCNVCHWRGLWVILDQYTGINEHSTWTCFALGQGLLTLLRCTKNAQAPPLIVCMDYDTTFFLYTTRFRIKRGLSEGYLWDVFCSVFIIHQLVVFYWRGAWNILEIYLLPDDLHLSAVYSLIIAYSLLALVAIMQPLLNLLYRRTRRLLWRWLLETFLYLFANFVNVATWRGLWMLLDQHVLTERPGLSAAVTLVAGVGGLMLMLGANSLTIRCVMIDGNPPDEYGCYCPTEYLRFIIKSCRICKKTSPGKIDKSNHTSHAFSDNNEEIFRCDKNIELREEKLPGYGIENYSYDDSNDYKENNVNAFTRRKSKSTLNCSNNNVSENYGYEDSNRYKEDNVTEFTRKRSKSDCSNSVTSTDNTECIGIQCYI